MQAKIIPIGTSRGIRIPKHLLDKYAFNSEVDIEDTGAGLLIKPIKKVRAGWQKLGIKAAATFEEPIIPMPSSDWDNDDWEW